MSLGALPVSLSLSQSSGLSHGIQGKRIDTALLPSATPSERPSLLGDLPHHSPFAPSGAPVRTRIPTPPESPAYVLVITPDMPNFSPNPSLAQGGTTCLALPAMAHQIFSPGFPETPSIN